MAINPSLRNGLSLQPNDVLRNQFKILDYLSEGGMGTVYRGRDLNFAEVKRLVAIKEMRLGDAKLAGAMIDIFRREANLLATLSHPAIPRIYSFFEQDSRVYLVMEYINGVDLDKVMQKAKSLPLEKVVEWGIELCDVLQYLHAHSPEPIVFRDMKPSNIMIDSHGRVRLVDFGIARSMQGELQADKTKPEQNIIGTPGYAPPEQYRGQAYPVSDIYAMGATLHHILTRVDPRDEPPFTFDRRPLKEYNPTVPDTLVAIVEKALHKDMADRWQSAAEMKAALERVRYGAVEADLFAGIGETPAAPAAPTVEPLWTVKTDGEILRSPVVLNNLAYFGTTDAQMWALNLTNQQAAWKIPTGCKVNISPAVDEDNRLMMYGTDEGMFSAVDAGSGREMWSYKVKDRIRSTATVAHHHVFFGSDDGSLYAIVSQNGRLAWEYKIGSEVQSQPCVTDDLVIVGAESGDVMALELSGTVRWGFRCKGRVYAKPVVDPEGQYCYIASYDRNLYVLDIQHGYKEWDFKANGPLLAHPVIGQTLIYFGAGDGAVYAVTRDTGKRRWTFETEKPIVSSPVLHDDVLYIAGNDGCVYCLEAASGDLRWKFQTGGSLTATPVIVNDMLLVGSLDHTLYALPLQPDA